MRLCNLAIRNYRSIRDISLKCRPQVTFLGPNNHGKSNVLAALDFGLSTSAKPMEADFFVHRDRDEGDLWVEMTFSGLTEQEQNTFKRYLLSDGCVCVRKTARLRDNRVETAYNGWTEEPDDDWLRFENAAEYVTRDAVSKTPLRDLVPQSGRITKAQIQQAQQQYIQEHRKELNFTRMLEDGPFLGQKNIGGGVLPEFFLIPAVRDLTDEIKIKTTTTFGRLMSRAIGEMAQRDPRFAQAQEQLEKVIDALNQRDNENIGTNELAVLERNIEQELSAWGVSVDIKVTPPEIEKLFELGTDIHLDDGVRTTADRKGHGLQRAMIFALLRSWAATLSAVRASKGGEDLAPRKQSDSIIFAMEEPELFLHPQAQRRLSASLREISDTPEHQVFLCTHSTHFVDLSHYKEIVLISKENPVSGSRVRQCTTEIFSGDNVAERKKRFHMAEWINPDRGEMFFARQVILVEGETEKVVLPFIAEKLGYIDPDVSIIDCGAKHNIPLYVTIAKAFSIPYFVIHDEDPLPDPIPDGLTGEKLKGRQHTYDLNAIIRGLVIAPLGSVEIFKPDFEGACGVSRSQADKKGKALAAIEHFELVHDKDLPKVLVDVVRTAYNK